MLFFFDGQNNPVLCHCYPIATLKLYACYRHLHKSYPQKPRYYNFLKCVEENIWTKEGWSDGRVEKAA
jgi:hypothetical protein